MEKLDVNRPLTTRVPQTIQLLFSSRQQAQEPLLQTQKLENIGILTSGIAHDFNNLLSTIMCGLSFAIAKLPPRGPFYRSTSCRARVHSDRNLLAASRTL
jgi:hypothetical protein